MLKFLASAVAALALLAATPAAACGDDCKNCPMHKKEAAAQTSKGAVAEADKKDEKGCQCMQGEKKECKCGEKCACPSCPVHGKKAEKPEKKS
jgi:hypothetical protein